MIRHLTEDDDGWIVPVATYDVVQLILREPASSGYLWSLDAHDGLRLAGDDRVPLSSAVGAAVARTWTFVPASTGRHALQLHLARPFERDKPPCQSIRIELSVSGEPRAEATETQLERPNDEWTSVRAIEVQP